MDQVKNERERAVSTEEISVGSSATNVFTSIVEKNPTTHALTYVAYNLEGSYEEGLVSSNLKQLLIRDFSKENLRVLSDNVGRFPTDLDTKGRHSALAISSLIIGKDGLGMHIPMMDFICEKGKKSLDLIAGAFAGYKGAILETDQSYHFWGSNLLSQSEFQDYLKFSSHYSVYGNSLGHAVYLAQCGSQGFSALRIFAYPPHKMVEPHVVRVLK